MGVARAAISLEEPLLERLDQAARELDLPRSRVLARAAEEFLERHESAHLLAQLNAAYAGAPTAEEKTLHAHRRRSQRRRVKGEW